MTSLRLLSAVFCLLASCRVAQNHGAPATPAPVPALEVVAPASWIYVVRRGDTLFEIAQGYDVSLEEIARLNEIEDPDLIAVGERLRIPLARSVRPARANPGRHRRELDLAERQLAQADFVGAEQRAERLRRELDPTEPGATELLIRLEEITAHIHAAHDDQQQATAAFERALRIDPRYAPSAMTPPKLLRAFQQAERDSGAR